MEGNNLNLNRKNVVRQQQPTLGKSVTSRSVLNAAAGYSKPASDGKTVLRAESTLLQRELAGERFLAVPELARPDQQPRQVDGFRQAQTHSAILGDHLRNQ